MSENDDEIWDEYKWEEFFRESDKRTEKYMQLMDKYMDHPDRDRIIAEEMGWTHLLDETEDDRKDWIDEYEEGEEWKQSTGYEPEEFDNFENFPLYQKAYEFAIDAKNLIRDRLKGRNDESIHTFSRFVTITPAKIAGGFSFGFEMESLGGNIANCKRALHAANRVLDALSEMGDKELLDRQTYLEFHERAKDTRDDLAIYIVELRELFRRGIS
jgi:hypothetical protein